jgi:membrane protein implicated in regulation of membrane protease activity
MSFYIWLILGVVALVVEMTIPTFFALFAGVGFFIAAGVAFLYPDALFWQLIVSAVFMVIGAIVFKNRHIAQGTTKGVGTHNEFVGICGKALTSLGKHEEGDVELYESVVSNRHWKALSVEELIDARDEVEIVELRGNTLLVKKHKN